MITPPAVTASPLTVSDLQGAFRRGELSPIEVVDEVLARVDRHEDDHIFLTVDASGARRAAREAAERLRFDSSAAPPLLGVPVTVKDLLPTVGLRTTRGSLVTRDWVPAADAPAVARLRELGAIIIGKTNTSEAGWKGDSGNRLLGPTVNPWDRTRSAGGSSGGAAAAVALGLGPVAIGTDGAGSVRIPASFCGVVGFKPSFGRIPYWPVSAENLAHVGVLARSVTDAADVVTLLSGADPRDMFSSGTWYAGPAPGAAQLRVGFTTTLGYASTEPAVADLCAAAVGRLADLGHVVENAEFSLPDPYPVLDVLWAGHEAASYRNDLDRVRHLLDPGRAELIDRGRRLSAADLADAHQQRHDFAAQLRTATERYDVLVTPTVPTVAFPLGQDGPTAVCGRPTPGLSWTPFTYPFNLTGQPAISVPVGHTTDGVPVGLQMVSRWRRDDVVIALAGQLDTALTRTRPAAAMPPVTDHQR